MPLAKSRLAHERRRGARGRRGDRRARGAEEPGAVGRAHEGGRGEVRRHARRGRRALRRDPADRRQRPAARAACSSRRRAPIAQEYFASVTWDGRAKLPVCCSSATWAASTSKRSPRSTPSTSRRRTSRRSCRSRRASRRRRSPRSASTGDELNRLTPIVFELMQLFLDYDLTLAEINPLARLEDGRFLVLDGHVDLEAEARGKHEALLAELGIGEEETRQARPPTPFEIAGAQGQRGRSPRRRRQRGRVRRQPRPRDRRGRRLAHALRRRPQARRQARQLLRDRRQPVA